MIIQLNNSNFNDFLWNSEALLMVMFYKENCIHCNKMKAELEELAKEAEHKVLFGKVDAQEEYELSDRYDINSLPTLLYFFKGEKKECLEGYYSSLVIQANMNKLIHLLS
ncbi:thioredoxin family protein [Anaerocolumna xylanovorans]|uniref:Thioredoxin 1 n=1 Tax=Anaerocolumna xylanovorans DSM 12503 TaxID=1121345 RepID=A0A1M7Y5E4_9FIRM|nr:protein disulfide isomerase family protein [Anaerocolumna xylanovorans]SHO47731.1 thioredoxin 1 [Anaerocolumna xylanovorans DSM 12503]